MMSDNYECEGQLDIYDCFPWLERPRLPIFGEWILKQSEASQNIIKEYKEKCHMEYLMQIKDDPEERMRFENLVQERKRLWDAYMLEVFGR